METRQKLDAALKDAMRANDDVHRRTIRLVLAAIKMQEIEKQAALDENAVLAILQKEVKSRRETITEARSAGRDDLVSAAEEEIAVLETFLPKALSDDELSVFVAQAIVETGAAAPADMGKVMKTLLPRLGGRAANDRVSAAVRQALQK